jgi:hypothetical protein
MGAEPQGMPSQPDVGTILLTLAKMPSPYKEMAALKIAREVIGVALNSCYSRSPQAAKECSAALLDVDQAMDTLGGMPVDMLQPPAPGMPTSGFPMGGAGLGMAA